ncbi:Tetratricopeptide TPR_2 repeat protein [Geobacter metallireducens RCH3]|uniref:tetratricopeptide repeat protein n=1 Tax=Geobacter TaxID=28231 RepID=UPI0000386BBE|nr:tetratricopeptide repeat protein [Geobacter grbiciae]EHP84721.1 Tetratricopeptide TPR_2 repeat protein [Geobacter metallireducens RCH3]MBT1074835.1 tetratricopeptide repeat protein [Geobacter grbiciae]
MTVNRLLKTALGCALLLLTILATADPGRADDRNRLRRIDVRPRSGFTRLMLKLDREPAYTLTPLAGNRVRVTLRDTDGARWKRLRSYSDPNIAGCAVARRRGDLLVTVGVKGDPRGVRAIAMPGVAALTLDVGSRLAPSRTSPFAQGRDGIKVGVEQLVSRFDPPVKSDIPFVPTDRRVLQKVLTPEEVDIVLAGEAALYRGQGSEAERIFAPIVTVQSPVKALAYYRLGEARTMLQKYGEALRDFREGEKLLPEFLAQSPGTAFAYADAVVRSGDLEGGRRMLGRLIASLADKKFAPVLLVRLADILSRQGKEMAAEAIYRTVAENFPDNKAKWQARMKLADRKFMTIEPATFRGLVDEYLEINRNSDFSLREESLFKAALLTALFGEAPDGFALVSEYEKKFSRGTYISVARGMREELIVPMVRVLIQAKDFPALITLAQENRDYLGRCIADPDFVRSLVIAFADQGRFSEEAELFSYLAGKDWSAPQAPELYRRIIEAAERTGDIPLLENSADNFLRRFPDHPLAQGYRERVAALDYSRGNLPKVAARLAPLLTGKGRPDDVESYYILGKSLESAGNKKDAERAMILFLSELRQRGGTSELAPDAHYVAASARLARGDRKGAMELLRAGSTAAPEAQRDPFLYKMGEIARLEGRNDEAAGHFKAVADKGKDPVWQQMAAQALADMELKKKLATQVKLSK